VIRGNVSGDYKQGHTVVDAAVEALTSAIVAAVADAAYMQAHPVAAIEFGEITGGSNAAGEANGTDASTFQSETKMGAGAGAGAGTDGDAGVSNGRQLQVNQFDREWWSSTADELKAVLEQVSAATTSHPHWSCRASFVAMADALLEHCSKPLLLLVPVLVEGLVMLATDEYTQVAAAAARVLRECAARRLESDLVTLVKENLLGLAIALPRVVQGGDDGAILRSMQLLAGYIQLLGSQIRVVYGFLFSFPHVLLERMLFGSHTIAGLKPAYGVNR
jgi:hypothetical protein